MKSGGGGTVKGNPVSAAYQLPASQVITFVGYQGTFTPAKVATILATLGTDPQHLPGGPERRHARLRQHAGHRDGAERRGLRVGHHEHPRHHRVLQLDRSRGAHRQPGKGAADTVKLRADVEAKK